MFAEIVIIGGGPAALSCAMYLNRLGLDFIIVAEKIGGKLNYYKTIKGLFPFGTYETVDFISMQNRCLDDVISKSGSKFYIVNQSVRSIDKVSENSFKITCNDGKTYFSNIVVVATGTEPFIPANIKNDKIEFYTFKDYPYNFLGRSDKVLVLGAGNTSIDVLTTIESLVNEIFIIDINDNNFNSLIPNKRKYLNSKKNCSIIFDANYNLTDKEIQYHINNEQYIYKYDKLILCTGETPNTDFLPYELLNALNGKVNLRFEKNDECINMSLNWDGLFAIGDIKNEFFTSNVSYAVSDGMRTAISINNYLGKIKNGTNKK